jgi:phytanoyl-CoA dioxygenase PhyH
MQQEVTIMQALATDAALFAELLDRDGYFVWPGLLPASLIDRHLAAYDELNASLGVVPGEDFHAYPAEKQAAVKQARAELHRESQAAQDIFFNQELMELLRDTFGEDPVLRQPETGYYHRRTPDHTDSLDFKVQPARREVRVWCALEDVHPDAGPVYFVAGSHRTISDRLELEVLSERPELGELLRSQMAATTPQEFFIATRPLWGYVKGVKLPRAIAECGSERKPLLLAKGDVIVFSSDTVHGTCRCANPSLTRKYCVAYWAARSAVWHHSRSYWGPLHDYRRPGNAIAAAVQSTPHGLTMSFAELHAAYLDSFAKAVLP